MYNYYDETDEEVSRAYRVEPDSVEEWQHMTDGGIQEPLDTSILMSQTNADNTKARCAWDCIRVHVHSVMIARQLLGSYTCTDQMLFMLAV